MRRSMTRAEAKFWATVRDRRLGGFKFRRQVWMGHYIVDFVCEERLLIIEIDGSQHGEAIEYDAKRTQWLAQEGYSVMRFSNRDVLKDIDGVLRAVEAALRGDLRNGLAASDCVARGPHPR